MDPRIVVIEESDHYLVADIDLTQPPASSPCKMLEWLREQGLDCIDADPILITIKKPWYMPDGVKPGVRVTCKKVPPCGY